MLCDLPTGSFVCNSIFQTVILGPSAGILASAIMSLVIRNSAHRGRDLPYGYDLAHVHVTVVQRSEAEGRNQNSNHAHAIFMSICSFIAVTSAWIYARYGNTIVIILMTSAGFQIAFALGLYVIGLAFNYSRHGSWFWNMSTTVLLATATSYFLTRLPEVSPQYQARARLLNLIDFFSEATGSHLIFLTVSAVATLLLAVVLLLCLLRTVHALSLAMLGAGHMREWSYRGAAATADFYKWTNLSIGGGLLALCGLMLGSWHTFLS